MKKYLTYQQLSFDEEHPSSEDRQQGKQQRRFEIQAILLQFFVNVL
jgi:hypothetical protein